MTLHVVQYSGGIGSWAATQRVIAEHGTDTLVLLVADTRVEDPDLWRFVHDSTARIGVEPTVVADGRTTFEVFRDQRFSRQLAAGTLFGDPQATPGPHVATEHADPADTMLYVGIDWSEAHCTPAIVRGWAPWRVRFPMCDPPLLTKQDMFDAARAAGIEPRLDYGRRSSSCTLRFIVQVLPHASGRGGQFALGPPSGVVTRAAAATCGRLAPSG